MSADVRITMSDDEALATQVVVLRALESLPLDAPGAIHLERVAVALGVALTLRGGDPGSRRPEPDHERWQAL